MSQSNEIKSENTEEAFKEQGFLWREELLLVLILTFYMHKN